MVGVVLQKAYFAQIGINAMTHGLILWLSLGWASLILFPSCVQDGEKSLSLQWGPIPRHVCLPIKGIYLLWMQVHESSPASVWQTSSPERHPTVTEWESHTPGSHLPQGHIQLTRSLQNRKKAQIFCKSLNCWILANPCVLCCWFFVPFKTSSGCLLSQADGRKCRFKSWWATQKVCSKRQAQ